MKIKDFINEYNSADEVGSESLIKAHIVRQYVPLEEKQARAEQIIGSAYRDAEGNLHVNSVARYMLTALAYVMAYTDLELELADGGALEAYNLLAQAGFFQKMQSYIPADEAEEFANVVDMVASDVMTNEYEPRAYIKARLESFATLLEKQFPTALTEIVERFGEDKIEEIVKKLGETYKA